MRTLFESFAADCARRIGRGEELDDTEAAAFCLWLEVREAEGHSLLGALAGPDGSIDTVTGRCGHLPARSRSVPR